MGSIRLRDILTYKVLLILDFTLIFLLVLFYGEFYTSLKLWLQPPIEHRVEVTVVPKYHQDVLPKLIEQIKGQELLVFADGVVAYVPLASKQQIMIHYPTGIAERTTPEQLLQRQLAMVIEPSDLSLYETWLQEFRRQNTAMMF